MARLIVKSGSAARTVELDPRNAVSIGRDPASEIPLEEEGLGISRKHCRVTAVPRGDHLAWEVSDMGATNKTRVNGRPADKVILTHGDLIQVGKVEILFEDPAEEERLRAAGSRGVCFLEWVSGPKRGEKVMLDASRVTLGRRETSTIVLDDRMASGHHAEITKDLNGYTLRDLGSTNGTLVNGEPCTEITLTHGTRVRIGASKLVFKDPSMKDIEVELSQFEDDDGWGMMGDIDLTRAKGSKLGLLVGLALVGAVGAGGWYLMQEEGRRSTGATVDQNFVADGDMESESAEGLWDPIDPDAPIRKSRPSSGKGHELRLEHVGDGEQETPQLVVYAVEFDVSGRPFRVAARVRGEGELVGIWSSHVRREGQAERTVAGSRLTSTIGLGTGSIQALIEPPSWAYSLRLGVRVAPGGRVTLDDVDVEYADKEASRGSELNPPGDSTATWRPLSGMDLVTVQTVLVAGAGPVARLPDGTTLRYFVPAEDGVESSAGKLVVRGEFQDAGASVPAQITWARSEEGLGFQVECEGSQSVGLDMGLLQAHLVEGVNLLTPSGPRTLAAAPGQRAEHVLKCLAGEPRGEGGRARTLVTIVPVSEPDKNAIELYTEFDPTLLRLRFLSEGSSASYSLLTNFEVQQRAAQERLAAARAMAASRPAQAVDALRALAQEYPFLKAVRDDALTTALDLETGAQRDIAAFEAAVDAFSIFSSGEVLAPALEMERALTSRFPGRGEASGALEQQIAALVERFEDMKTEFLRENAGKELSRLERLAGLLENTDGYRPMAVIYYREIVRRFGGLETDERFAPHIQGARAAIEELSKDTTVAASIPEMPR